MSTVVHPIILLRPGEEPFDEIVLAHEVNPVARLRDSLYSAMQWWWSKGVRVTFAPIRAITFAHNIDLTAVNPWQQTWRTIFTELELGIDIDGGEKALVFLKGWPASLGLGWGGNPMALVGDYALDLLLSPDQYDDRLMTGVCSHEIGHVLGLGHDAGERRGIMWRWWDYPEVPLGVRPGVTRLMAAAMGAQACPFPP